MYDLFWYANVESVLEHMKGIEGEWYTWTHLSKDSLSGRYRPVGLDGTIQGVDE